MLYINLFISGIALLLMLFVDKNFPEGVLFKVALQHKPPYNFGTDASFALAKIQGYGIFFIGIIFVLFLVTIWFQKKNNDYNINRSYAFSLVFGLITFVGLIVVGLRAGGTIYNVTDSGKAVIAGSYWDNSLFLMIALIVLLVMNVIAIARHRSE